MTGDLTGDLFGRLAARAHATGRHEGTVSAVRTDIPDASVGEPHEPAGERPHDSPGVVVVDPPQRAPVASAEFSLPASPTTRQSTVQPEPAPESLPPIERVVAHDNSVLTERVVEASRAEAPERVEPSVQPPPLPEHVERHHMTHDREVVTQHAVRPAPTVRSAPSRPAVTPSAVEAHSHPPTIEIRIDRLIVGVDDARRPLADPHRDQHRRPSEPTPKPTLGLADYLATRGTGTRGRR